MPYCNVVAFQHVGIEVEIMWHTTVKDFLDKIKAPTLEHILTQGDPKRAEDL